MKGLASVLAPLLCLLIFSATAAAAPSASPVDRHTLQPGQLATWTAFNTTGTEFFTNQDAIISWDDVQGGRYAATNETFMLLGFRLVQGAPHRMFNGHSTPADSPYGWTPPDCDGGTPTGVSPFAIDYQGDSRGLQYTDEPEACNGHNYHFTILSQAEMEARRGQWVWLWVDIVWGRRTDAKPGAAKIWIAGEDTPRVSVSGINTHYPGQGMVTFWSGEYWSKGAPATEITDVAAPHFGRTPQEAYLDTVKSAVRWEDGSSVPLANPGLPDPAVPFPLQWSSSTSPQCSNGINDDPSEDTLVDYPADPGCTSASDNSELGNPSVPLSAPSYSSNIRDGDVVQQGTTWNVSVTPTVERVELWADDRRLADCAASACSTTIDAARFSLGAHQLGVVYTLNGQRVSFGTGGVMADITIIAAGPQPDTQPPTAPTNLRATTSGQRQIDLSWTASTDNVGVTGYRIERCSGDGCTNFDEIANQVGTSFTDGSLQPSLSYAYRVVAYDAAGNESAYSSVVRS
jgi:Fibronectin type III domain